MAISVMWDNPEKTVIRYDFDGEWKWDDLWTAVQTDDELMAGVDHTVHLLFNLQQTKSIPPNPLAQMEQFSRAINPKLGLIVFCGGSMWTKTVGEIFYKYFARHIDTMRGIRFTQTLDEARSVIAEHHGQSGR